MTAYPPPGASVPDPSSREVRVVVPLSKPRLSYVFLGINVAVWLLMTAYGYTQGWGLNGTESTEVLRRFGAQENLLIAQGEFWRLLTSNYIHIGILHLLFNSYALYILGQDVERLYGSSRFVIIYLLSGLGGSLAFYLLGDTVTSAGASGAIFGLIGTEIAFLWIHRDKFGRQRLFNLLLVAGFNLFLGATVPQINNIAHVGGLVTGLLLGWLLVPAYSMPSPAVIGADNVITLEDRSSLQRRLVALTIVAAVLVAIGALGSYRWSTATAVAVPPTSDQYDRAVELLESERYEEAAALLRPLAEQRPDDGAVLFYLGLAEANLGNLGTARRLWTETTQLLPDFAGTHWNLALLYIDLGRLDDAARELEAFISLTDSPSQREEAEQLLQELGRRSP